ncbi:Tetratricopeptide TPR_2 repeat protein [Pirellula staleyi DSM 6068]|uniref:Tetratricopeptide TPR_2 repeat protein n=1 Tax=Pirellula staleyi (strain ATCC 27377 / DSM 6068 / ICPB 4128) TaxID=530564 RepID=D2R4L9_PIRSD|nr:tetratricopeptide repeat protein [Pirellula staleyi]ADB17085.1 Tetratricopeptide TPR_2 repeat protein [Pirellula staleyi DSM 6068]
MSESQRIRRQQTLREAEGYLDLITVFGDRWPCHPDHRDKLAERVLSMLGKIEMQPGAEAQVLMLQGQALRAMQRYVEAAAKFNTAAALDDSHVPSRLALGWCYKRCRRLDLAIQALEEAMEIAPHTAIIHYNLACYWSLAGNAKIALIYLAQAIEMQPKYRDLVGKERDFDNVRQNPNFLALTSVIV